MNDSPLTNDLQWTPSALAMLKKIPFFVRPQATVRIQHLARTAGVEVVTVELVEQARLEFGQ
ncbi:PCP reductase family protein [Synechocystis sp. PCC 7509]|uniref:PCP reductase family protein n=1 Tax=Synechocystis sp. PCC 7509 TaxID=927677 RepID=UPI0002ACD1C1|nr:PCP reductase family protein [Synechocystis sp. PCC 7509]